MHIKRQKKRVRAEDKQDKPKLQMISPKLSSSLFCVLFERKIQLPPERQRHGDSSFSPSSAKSGSGTSISIGSACPSSGAS